MTDIKINIVNTYLSMIENNKILVDDNRLYELIKKLISELNSILDNNKYLYLELENNNKKIMTNSKINSNNYSNQITILKNNNYKLNKLIDRIKSDNLTNKYTKLYDAEKDNYKKLLDTKDELEITISNLQNSIQKNNISNKNNNNDNIFLRKSNYIEYLRNNKQSILNNKKLAQEDKLKLNNYNKELLELENNYIINLNKLKNDVNKNIKYYDSKISNNNTLYESRLIECKNYKLDEFEKLKKELDYNYNTNKKNIENDITSLNNIKIKSNKVKFELPKIINNIDISDETIYESKLENCIHNYENIINQLEKSQTEQKNTKKLFDETNNKNTNNIFIKIKPYLEEIEGNTKKISSLTNLSNNLQHYKVMNDDNIKQYEDNKEKLTKLKNIIDDLKVKIDEINYKYRILYND